MSKIKWHDRSTEYKKGWEDGATFVKIVVYGLVIFMALTLFFLTRN